MQPLSDWSVAERCSIKGIFTDIDDTLTTRGHLNTDARQALQTLRAAGITVMAITGRPVAWSEPKALSWPVAAVIAENGAVALLPKADGLCKTYQLNAVVRAEHRQRLRQAADRVLREVPGVALAEDSAGRETDIAFDHSEFASLDESQITAIEAVLRAEGLHTTRSSIHLHGSVSHFDKWLGATWAVRELLGRDLHNELDQWVAVGDSGNDEAMFQHFRHSVGVANICHARHQLRFLPRFVTTQERGAGFAELAHAILGSRSTPSA